MKSIKIKKNIHCFEKLLNRLFKNGNKYSMLKNFKNILFLFGIFRKYFKRKNLRFMFFSKNLVEEELLDLYLPEYSVSYKIKKDFKKKKKTKKLTGSIVKINKEITELYKWWYLLFYKIPIRTLKLKLFYFILLIYIVVNNIHKLVDESKEIFADSNVFYRKKFKWKFYFFKKKKKKMHKYILKNNVKNIIWTFYLFLILF